MVAQHFFAFEVRKLLSAALLEAPACSPEQALRAVFDDGRSLAERQVQLIRDRHALPITRDYMAEAETRLRAL